MVSETYEGTSMGTLALFSFTRRQMERRVVMEHETAANQWTSWCILMFKM